MENIDFLTVLPWKLMLGVGLLVVIVAVIKAKSEQRRKQTLTFSAQTRLATNNELRLLRILRRILPDGHHAHCQTSLQAVLKAGNFRSRQSINRRRLDFVITDDETNIIAVLELDDSSHLAAKQRERDRQLDEFLADRHVLIRIKSRKTFDEDWLICQLAGKAGIVFDAMYSRNVVIND